MGLTWPEPISEQHPTDNDQQVDDRDEDDRDENDSLSGVDDIPDRGACLSGQRTRESPSRRARV
jgi:hypothetical protein